MTNNDAETLRQIFELISVARDIDLEIDVAADMIQVKGEGATPYHYATLEEVRAFVGGWYAKGASIKKPDGPGS